MMFRVCYLIVIVSAAFFFGEKQKEGYRIENNTPYTISKIRLFEQNLTKEIPPYGYINGYEQFNYTESSVFMFYADGLNYGVYISKPNNEKPLLICIDSINSSSRNVIISH